MNNIKTTLLAALLVTASIANASEEGLKKVQLAAEIAQETKTAAEAAAEDYERVLLEYRKAWHYATREHGGMAYISLINQEFGKANGYKGAEIGVQLNTKGQIDSAYIAVDGNFPHDVQWVPINFGGEVYNIEVYRSKNSSTAVRIKDVETFMRLMKDSDLTAVQIDLLGKKSSVVTFTTQNFLFNRTNK